MKASDPDYSTWVALTKLATKEDPITNKKQLDQALMQIKATMALNDRLNARNAAERIEAEALKLQIESQKVQLLLLNHKSSG